MEENACDEEKKCQLGGGGVQTYVRRVDGYYTFPSHRQINRYFITAALT